MPRAKTSRVSSRARVRPPLVLVTGASQGIGAEIALAYARAFGGVRLALVARNARNLATVEKRCAKLGADAHAFVCDVSDDAAVGRLSAAVEAEFGAAPDIVVNNAGRFKTSPLVETDAALFDEMIAANLRSAYLVTRAFLPALRKRASGDLVFINSICGLTGLAGCAAYTIAKHGLTGLTAALRAETKGSGVRVLSIHPGATETPIWDGSGVPGERLMRPASVASAVVALTSLDANTVAETITLRPSPGDLLA